MPAFVWSFLVSFHVSFLDSFAIFTSKVSVPGSRLAHDLPMSTLVGAFADKESLFLETCQKSLGLSR